MAITRYAGDRFTANTSDTKPTGVLDGAYLIDTGNLTQYVRRTVAGTSQWSQLAGGGGGGTPGGANTQVQFNNAGAFGGDADLTFTDGNRLNVNKLGISGNIYDSNNSIGNNGMVLTNEGTTGVQWKNIESVLSGVGGSGVANYVARWSDEDTITTGALYDDGGSVGVGTTVLGEALTVNGKVEADEFLGELRGPIVFGAKAAEALVKGEAVYISGISGNTTVVAKACANETGKMPVFGLAHETVSANAFVEVTTFGTLSNINTSSFLEGDELFVGITAGALVNSPPTGEAAQIQKIAKVTRSDTTVGSVKVMGAGRSNATPNLNEGRLFVGNSSNQAVADGTIHVDIANSKVGIGTASPSETLEINHSNHEPVLIKSTGNYNSMIVMDSNRSSANSYVGGLAGKWNGTQVASIYLRTGSDTTNKDDGYITLLTASSGTLVERMRIQSDGNVGIGTTAPIHKLEVVDAGAVNVVSRSSGGTAALTIDRASVNDDAQLLIKTASVNKWRIATGLGGNDEKLTVYDDIANVNMMSFKTAVGVGVGPNFGTAEPIAPLHVKQIDLADDSRNALLLLDGKFAAASVNSGDEVGIAFRVENSGGGAQQTTSITSSYQANRNSVNLQPNGGNVGIGTNNPGYPLTVANGITQARVDLTLQYLNNIDSLTNTDLGRVLFRAPYSGTGNNVGSITLRTGASAYRTDLRFKVKATGGSERQGIIIHGTNNGALVGIGQLTDPTFPFQVSASNLENGPAKRIALFFDETDAAAGTGAGIALGGYVGAGTDPGVSAINDFGVIQGIKENSTLGNYASAMLFLTRENSANPAEQMRITSAGSVGIGTTAPLGKLHVYGGQVRILDSTALPSYGARLVVGRDTAQDLEFIVDDLDCKIVADQDSDSDGNHNFILDRSFAGAGDNNFQIQKGGSSQFLINTDGNVGINNTSPEHRLHVAGDAIISGYLYDSTNSTGVDGYVLTSKEDGPQWKMIEDVLSGVGGNGTANYIPKWEDEDTIGDSVIAQSGDAIGVGTAMPAGTFTVKQAGTSSNDAIRIEGTGDANYGLLRVNSQGYTILYAGGASSGGLENSRHLFLESARNIYLNPTAGTTNVWGDRLHVRDNRYIDFGDAVDYSMGHDTASDNFYIATSTALGTPRISLQSDGNVGIGVTSTNAKLKVVTSNTDIAIFQGTHATTTNFYISNSNATANNTANLYFAPANKVAGALIQAIAIEDFSVSANRTADLAFQTRKDGTFAQHMRITAGGNVSIGSSHTPQYPLDVKKPTNNNDDTIINARANWANTSDDKKIGSVQFVAYDEDVNSGSDYITAKIGSRAANVWTAASNVNADLVFETVNSATLEEQVRIAHDGNVGIGTASTDYKLTVLSGSGEEIRFYRNATSYLKFAFGTSNPAIYSGGEIQFFANGSTVNSLKINSSLITLNEHTYVNGNVGIGTTTPSVKLDISVNTTSDVVARISNEDNTTATADAYLHIVTGGTSGGNAFTRYNILGSCNWSTGIDNSDSDTYKISFSSNLGTNDYITVKQNGAIQFNTYGSGTHTGTAAYRLMVDSSGNVIEGNLGAGVVDGSGTTNYIARWSDTDTIGNSNIFDNGTIGIGTAANLNGKVTIREAGNSGTPNHIFCMLSSAAVGHGASIFLKTSTSNTNNRYGARIRAIRNANDNAAADLAFSLENTGATAVAEVVRFTSDGCVGIGTTDPGQKLHVNGSAEIDGSIYLNDTNTRLHEGSGNSLRITTNSGYVELGPENTSFSHFYTDRGRYYFNKEIVVDSGIIRSYNEDLQLDASYDGAVAKNIIFRTGNVEKMRMDTAGSFGIGTNGPAAKLDVRGNILRGDLLFNHWVTRSINTVTGNSSTINYILIAPKTTANVRLSGRFICTRATGVSAVSIAHADIVFCTDNDADPQSGGIHSASSDIPTYGHANFEIVELEYSSTEYYALKISPSASWTASFGQIEFEGIANNITWTNIDSGNVSNVGAFGGSQAVFAYKHANVGIGTDSPSARLHITSDGSHDEGAEIVLRHANNNSTDVVSTLSFQNNGGQVAMIQGGTTSGNNNGYISFFTDNAGTSGERMRIVSNGDVGIGTAIPYNKLHVNGTGRINSLIVGNSGVSNVPAAALHIKSSGTDAVLRIEDSDSSNQVFDLLVDQGVGFQIIDKGSTGSGTDTRLTIDTNGNVGIGSTQPGVALDVSGKLSIGSPNASYDLYNNGTTYLNGNVTVDATLSVTGGVAGVSVINSSTTDSAAADSYLNIFKTAGSGGGSRATLRVGYDATACFQISRIRNNANIYINSRQSGSAMVFQIQDTEKMNLTSSALTFVSGHQLRWGDSSTYITGSNSSDFLQFYPNGSVQLTLNSSGATIENDLIVDGSVGIGTTNPGTNKLYVNGNSYLDGTAYVDDNLTVDGNIHFETLGNYISFYGDNSRRHSIVANNSLGNAADDLRINTYGALYINLDSNDNNTSGADFSIGRHGDTGTLSDWLLDLSGETGKLRLYKYGSGTHTGTAAYRLMVDSSGNVIEGNLGAGVVDGSGTANKVAKWTDTDTIGDSQITDNGTSVGINTGSPAAANRLEINGQTKGTHFHTGFDWTAKTGGFHVGNDGVTAGAVSFYDGVTATSANIYREATSSTFYVGARGGSATSGIGIFSDGNVGIGTTAIVTWAKFQVQGAIHSTSLINSDDYFRVRSGGATKVIIEGNGSSYFNGGSVGIGTATPTTKLHVYGNNAVSGLSNLAAQFSATGTGGLGIGDENGTDPYLGLLVATDDFHIKTGGNNNRVTVLSGGNVGIGTATPRTNLHVYGTGVDNGLAKVRIGGNTNNTAMLELAETENGSGVMTYGFSMRADGGSGGGSTNDFQIRYHNNSTSGVTGFHMERADGNIGIGTVSSGYKLQVNGAFAATTKSFVIDHPTKPGKKLRYASLEGPENGVYVRGKGESDVIELPDYWTELIHEESITVNLVPIGSDSNNNIRAYSVKDIKDNKVYIYTDSSDNVYKYFFTVYGERKDVERLEVEID